MAGTSATIFLHLRPETPVSVRTLKSDTVDTTVLHIGANVSVISDDADLQRIARAIDAGSLDER